MWHITWRSLLAHRLRLALTAVAVVLGIAFVSGTFVLTDTLRASFDELFAEVTSGVDLTVRGRQAFSGSLSQDQRPPVPESIVAALSSVDGIAAVEGEVQGVAQLLDAHGQPIGGLGPPTIGASAPVHSELASADLRAGRYPARSGEVAIDAGTAAKHGFAVGDTVGVLAAGPATEQTVVGLLGFGELDSFGGATLVLFDPETARQLYGQDGYTSVGLLAADGVELEHLRDRVAQVVGADYDVLTGEELAADVSADVSAGLGFFNTALLVFAGIALFVGAMLIANTFSMLVAQRTRELALLRAVGAGRGQLLRSVLAEAAATGLVGSGLGLGLGIGVAAGLRELLARFGIPLPDAPLLVQPRTAAVAQLVGVAVTTLSAVAPAIKAVRIPPVAALQAVPLPPPARASRIRVLVGGLVTAIGLALLAAGLFNHAGIRPVGAGAATVLVGLSLLSVFVTRPLLVLLGWPIRRAFGIRGELAQQNAVRNPRRTAATASALMIGLGLVSFVMIFGASITRSAAASIDNTFRAEFTVQAAGATMTGFSPEVAERLAALPTVEAVTPTTFTEVRKDGATVFALGVDATTVEETMVLDPVAGDLGDLAAGGVAVKEAVARREGWAVGDRVPLEFALTGVQQVPARAVWDGAIDVDWILGDVTMAENTRALAHQTVYVKLADGVSVEQARGELEAAVADFPGVRALDQTEQKARVAEQVNQLLGLLSALLFLSIVIALFGIVNTLGLSVFERIRELGLLRAIGATRGQLRSVVRWESVLIAVLGATFGIGIGVLFGWLVTKALAEQGITEFALPIGQLAAAVIAAAGAGMLAAVVPGRRASRIDILRALDAE
jgi:putative ABC transport system permease protein